MVDELVLGGRGFRFLFGSLLGPITILYFTIRDVVVGEPSADDVAD